MHKFRSFFANYWPGMVAVGIIMLMALANSAVRRDVARIVSDAYIVVPPDHVGFYTKRWGHNRVTPTSRPLSAGTYKVAADREEFIVIDCGKDDFEIKTEAYVVRGWYVIYCDNATELKRIVDTANVPRGRTDPIKGRDAFLALYDAPTFNVAHGTYFQCSREYLADTSPECRARLAAASYGMSWGSGGKFSIRIEPRHWRPNP